MSNNILEIFDRMDDIQGLVENQCPNCGANLSDPYTTKCNICGYDQKDLYVCPYKIFKQFKLKDSKYKTIIEIVTCADCLDASTDAVGRSYKKGISLDNFLEELKEGSGTRYAPYLYELVSKEEVRKEIEDLLTKGRKENYKKAFEILQTYETNW